MAKIAPAQADAFVKKPDSGTLGVLVYGPDIGLVSERTKSLIHASSDHPDDPMNQTEITPEQLKEGPAALVDECLSIGLLSQGKRIIRIREATHGLAKILEEAFSMIPDSAASDVLVIVTANDLSKGKLRDLFEKDKRLAAVACYVENTGQLTYAINEFIRSLNIQAESGVSPYIAEHCQGDRLLMKQEIEKLFLYIGGEGKQITMDDVYAVVGDNTASTIDDICMAACSGKRIALQQHLHKAYGQGIMPVQIIRSLQRYLIRIHNVSNSIANGSNFDAAAKQLRPPVFFKQMPLFKQHVRLLSGKNPIKLWQARQLLYEAEMACKDVTVDSELLCERYIMKFSYLAA